MRSSFSPARDALGWGKHERIAAPFLAVPSAGTLSLYAVGIATDCGYGCGYMDGTVMVDHCIPFLLGAGGYALMLALAYGERCFCLPDL